MEEFEKEMVDDYNNKIENYQGGELNEISIKTIQ
jgi:hypothetical protein